MSFQDQLVRIGEEPSIAPTPDNKRIFLFVSIIVTIAIIYAMRDEEKFSILKKDFSNPVFLFFFVLIVFFSFLGMNYNDKKINGAVEKATIAFITAYLAHLNMSFAVFFIVAIFAYYFGSTPI